jgi:hypothetical protein
VRIIFISGAASMAIRTCFRLSFEMNRVMNWPFGNSIWIDSFSFLVNISMVKPPLFKLA